ncbi:protein transporter tim10 [Malassezia furfur]|uniref:Mitochondrial import inner membrane translocase subunit n=1 Tax=Malassezia furfur TaxID=55194 RepID=A0ABY8ETH2_MALFU|nr:hypothetical protein CBS9595_003045 [Malassezia furfur]KAI3624773.1 TIM10 [Malassezia furfur]WFD48895.1 protein transporter tim10 [Malassezia furfur]
MPLFGGGGSSQPAAANSAQIEAATAELDMITDVFNRLVDACHTKCINTRYAEPDLNKGESVCLDRCVAKFFAVNAKVGEQMQAIGQSAGMGGGSTGGMFG